MKHLLPKLFFVLLLLVSTIVVAQVQPVATLPSLNGNHNAKIVEIYGTALQSNNPELYQAFYNLLDRRIYYKMERETLDEKYPKLSQIGLLSKNNASISHDATFDANTFNPLKYDLNFFDPKNTQIYRFDGTDYLIIIEPQIIPSN